MTDLAHADTLTAKAQVITGFVVDAILGTSAIGAWVLKIEQVLGAVGAAVIFLLALGTAMWRYRYWRSRAQREEDRSDS